jgi:ribonucleoside-diphosphate reductase alpha chain
LKFNDGSLDKIEAIPQDLKDKHQEAFAIDPLWLIEITAARGKWIDQSQSHNVFMSNVSGKMLNDVYFAGWHAGLKTFYYFRTLGASQIEKSTLDAKKFGFTQKRAGAETAAGQQAIETAPEVVAAATSNVVQEESAQDVLEDAASCSLSTDPDCEVCQ